MKSTEVFKELEKRMKAQKGQEIVKKINAIYLWNITKEGKQAGTWSKIKRPDPL